MAATGACVFHGGVFSSFRRDWMSSNGSFKSAPIVVPNAKQLAVSVSEATSVEYVASTTSSPETTVTSSVGDLFGNGRFEDTREQSAMAIVGVGGEGGARLKSGLEEVKVRRSLKDYFEQSVELIRSDGGPPRWFSPMECGSRMDNSPLLLFLPGWFTPSDWIIS